MKVTTTKKAFFRPKMSFSNRCCKRNIIRPTINSDIKLHCMALLNIPKIQIHVK